MKHLSSENKVETDKWMQSFGYPIMENGVGYREETIPGNDSGYDGKVFVIMGNETYSSGAHFVWQ